MSRFSRLRPSPAMLVACITERAQRLKAPADLVMDRRWGWLVVPENDGNRLSVYRSGTAGR